jgi:hypothetical protein
MFHGDVVDHALLNLGVIMGHHLRHAQHHHHHEHQPLAIPSSPEPSHLHHNLQPRLVPLQALGVLQQGRVGVVHLTTRICQKLNIRFSTLVAPEAQS